MNKWILGVGLSVLTSCAPTLGSRQTQPTPLDFAPMAGSWSGDVAQKDTQSVYGVKLTLAATALVGAVAGSSDYPSLGCGGNLVAVQRNGDTAVVREVLTYGQGKCLNNVLLYLTANGNGTLTYTFYQSGKSNLTSPNGIALLMK